MTSTTKENTKIADVLQVLFTSERGGCDFKNLTVGFTLALTFSNYSAIVT